MGKPRRPAYLPGTPLPKDIDDKATNRDPCQINQKRPCRSPGCAEITDAGYCKKHQAIRDQIYDRELRPERSAFYSTQPWQKCPTTKLSRQPLAKVCIDAGRQPSALAPKYITASRLKRTSHFDLSIQIWFQSAAVVTVNFRQPRIRCEEKFLWTLKSCRPPIRLCFTRSQPTTPVLPDRCPEPHQQPITTHQQCLDRSERKERPTCHAEK